MNNPATRRFRDYWTFTGNQKPSPRSALRFYRRLFISPYRLGDNSPLPSRYKNKYSNSGFWPGSYLQIIFSILFNISKKYFFCRFSEYFFRFHSCSFSLFLRYLFHCHLPNTPTKKLLPQRSHFQNIVLIYFLPLHWI